MSLLDPTSFGPNTFLIGDSGTGKTTAARTMLAALRRNDPEAQLLTTFTEPRWQPLADLQCSQGLHITYVKPGASGWDAMIRRSENLTKLPWEANVKGSDANKSKYMSFVTLLNTIANYTCSRCGKVFGDVTELPSTWGYWLDSLSGINAMAMQMVVGGAVAKSQPQWGAAMDSELQLVNELCYETKCWFTLIAHVEKQVDELNGGMTITANALGRKVAPELPKNFDDVVQAIRTGDKFKWSNMGVGTVTKPTYLPISDNLPPDFGPIMTKWRDIQAKKAASLPKEEAKAPEVA